MACLDVKGFICMYINTGADAALVMPVSARLQTVGVGKASQNRNKLCQQHCKKGEIQYFP